MPVFSVMQPWSLFNGTYFKDMFIVTCLNLINTGVISLVTAAFIWQKRKANIAENIG